MKILKGDSVKIIAGKDLGKTGTVDRVLPKKNRIVVNGVNVVKRHVRAVADMQGGVMEINKSIDVSNALLICPNCKKPTRVGYKIEGETKLRFCKKCQKEILETKK